jgi:hypothetical protein
MDQEIPVMAMMPIIIPTLGRIDKQTTLEALPRELLKVTMLVCPKREASELDRLYKDKGVNIVVEPYPNMKIAQTREWIVQECYRGGDDKIIMLDDDLVFSTRISANDWHLREIHGEELIPEFQRIEDKLGPEYPHVGFGPRQGNRWESGGWKSPGKMVYALGYYLPILAKECRFDQVELREDYYVTLQLLLKGYPNAIWTGTVVNQTTDAPGGCRTYRTPEMSDAEGEKLRALFPEYVAITYRDYKTSVPRKEPIVQWQKALEDGLRKRCQLENQA